MYVRRLELVDFRSLRAGRRRPRAGAERAGRRQRRRQDQPGRGAGLRGDPGSPPGRHRRAAGPAGRAARGGPVRGRARRPRAAGRAGDRARQGQPGPAGPVAGDPGPGRARRAAAGAVRAGGPGAGPRRPGRAPPLPRRPAGRPAAPVRRRAGRLRAGAQAAQRPAAHRVPGPQDRRRRGGGDLSTLDVWDTHLAQHGAELLAGRLELVAALAPHVAKAYDAVAPAGARPASRTGPSIELADADRRTGPTLERGADWPRWPRPAPPRSSGASRWSARTATSWR